MYFGFVVRHVARKLLVATTTVAAATLITKAGRRFARVGVSAIVGATKAAASEIKATQGR